MEEKKKRGRPKKVVEPKTEEVLNDKVDFKTAPKDAYDSEKATTLADEPPKYQTTPMSNWAIENRKRKLGLKD
jgi:hypothetical protein